MEDKTRTVEYFMQHHCILHVRRNFGFKAEILVCGINALLKSTFALSLNTSSMSYQRCQGSYVME